MLDCQPWEDLLAKRVFDDRDLRHSCKGASCAHPCEADVHRVALDIDQFAVATVLLNTLGYKAKNMKFGMMGWTTDSGVLNTTPFSGAPGYPTVANGGNN